MDIDKIVEAVLASLNSNNSNLLVYPANDSFANDILSKNNINYEFYTLNCDTNGKEKLLITQLENTQLYNISVGASCCELSTLVLDFLLRGKEVIVLNSALKYKLFEHTANKNLINLYNNYVEVLKSFSVRFVTESEFFCEMQINNSAKNIISENKILDTNTFSGSLLTEKIILSNFNVTNSTLYVNKKCIVTSLAKDTARELNISIVHMEE